MSSKCDKFLLFLKRFFNYRFRTNNKRCHYLHKFTLCNCGGRGIYYIWRRPSRYIFIKKDNIFIGYCSDDVLINVMRIIFTLTIILTLPFQIFPPRIVEIYLIDYYEFLFEKTYR